MDLAVIKEMFSDDDDDVDNITVIKEEMELYFESESIQGSNQHENFYQDLEPVEKCPEAIPTGNSIPPPSEKKQIQCNRIILGSKPNRVFVDQKSFENFTKPYQINVVLVDVQSYLQVSKRYCGICLTLFSESSDYLNHHETFHAPNMPNISQNEVIVSKSIVHQCNICANTFSSNTLLRTHIEQSHNKPNNNNNDEIKRSSNNICNQYNANLSHKCFHCNEIFETQKFLIEHLYDILHTKKNTSDIMPVLKSILFKCHKCDIHFVSLQVAEYHSEHMEMLINWKCSICYRIFKKEDELNHERQHSVSNNFVTYNLAEVDVSKILFKCYKCYTHFTENAFLHHFRDCGLEILHSVYCDRCDILLDSTLKIVHESDHCCNDFNIRKLTVIETEVISENPVDAVNEFQIRRKVSELEQLCSEVKVVIHRLDTNELCSRMKSNINNNEEIWQGLASYDTSSLNIDEIHSYEESEPGLVGCEATSDIILKYDDESDQCLDFEDIPQTINEMHNNNESEPTFESLEIVSPNSDMVLMYDESSSETFEVVSKSDKILNNKKSESRKNFFDSISPCSVASENIDNEETEVWSSTSDAIPILCPQSSQDIPPESDNILNNKETETRFDSFETDLPTIDEIIISDESEVEFISEIIPQKSKDTLHNRIKAGDKVEKHGKSFSQSSKSSNRKRNFGRNRKKEVSKGMSNNINRKRALSTDGNPTDNIKRPKLAYFYCDTCKCVVTKFRKNLHKQSRCKNLVQVVCTLCGLAVTNYGMISHNRLHDKSKMLKIWDFTFYNIHNDQLMKPPLPEYPKCLDCNVHFLTKSAQVNHTCNEGEYLTCNKCEIRLSEAAFRLHMEYHSYLTNDYEKSKNHTIVQYINNEDHGSNEGKAIDNVINSQKSILQCDKTIQNDEENAISLKDMEIVYTCRNCCVTVDTYDKMIEHCQGHYIIEEEVIETEKCNICQLNIDKSCYLNHHNMHEKGYSLKVLKFDSYYFPSENKMWIKHVFKTVPQEKVTEILNKSIYRFEGRIKMDIVQEGPPELTVYKCDRCCCFIDPCSMYKHSENSCFKLRPRLCTICGLPFISAESQLEHEKIHQRPGITLKSYRIVLFNQERDQQLNSSFYFRKRYVIYLCRNCGGIIDKLQLVNHQCDKSDLKKCSQCGLFLYSREYEAHANIHEEFDSFNDKNMKVILLGEVKTGAEKVEKTIRTSFLSLIYDYRIYKCKKCQLCVRNENCIPKHSCHLEKKQYRCPKCSLQFSVSRLKTHMRNHERDSFYLLSNMTIVSFDPSSYDLNKNTSTALENGDRQLSDSNTDSDSDIVTSAEEKSTYKEPSCEVTETVEEEIANLYKCVCGLHFLNEASIMRHFGVCKSKSKASKQMCPKCDLLFSTNILFTHLLAHHSNKNRRYKYDIIEMANK